MSPIVCRNLGLLAVAALIASLAGGCASWTDRPTEKKNKLNERLALAKLSESNRAIVLDIDFVTVRLPATNGTQTGTDSAQTDAESLWQWVDETAIASDTRTRLLENGIRAGKIIRNDRFRRTLDQWRVNGGAVDAFLTKASVASELTEGGKRIPMRCGRRYELPVKDQVSGQCVSLIRLGGETIGRTLSDPQYLFAITPQMGQTPQQVDLRLRPEIQHGAMKQTFVSSDSAIRIDARRESWSLPELEIQIAGVQDETLVIGTTSPSIGLGQQMLTGHSADRSEEQMVILIKLAHIPTPADRL